MSLNNNCCNVRMVNFHESCDSTLCVELGSAIASSICLSCLLPYKATKIIKAAESTEDIPDLVFTDRKVDWRFFSNILKNQSVNRVPFLDGLTLKIPLANMFRHFDNLEENEGEFHAEEWSRWASGVIPLTYTLPHDVLTMKRILNGDNEHMKSQFYICKPNNGSQGYGIVIQKGLQNVLNFFEATQAVPTSSSDNIANDVPTTKGTPTWLNPNAFDGTYVVQPYVDNPGLYKGRKFDLRLYVVMIGSGGAQRDNHVYEDAKGLLLRSGYARLCATQYSAVTEENMSIPSMHIANDAQNFKEGVVKMSDILLSLEYVVESLATQAATDNPDTEVTQEYLWHELARVAGVTLAAFQHRIRQQCKQVLPEVIPNEMHRKCYQLLGLDVMIDSNYKVWVLECNAKPCMDWEKEEVEKTITIAINTEVMGVALSVGMALSTPEAEYSPDDMTEKAVNSRLDKLFSSDMITKRAIVLDVAVPITNDEQQRLSHILRQSI